MDNFAFGAIFLWVATILTIFAAWVTHVINTIQDSEWLLLIIGIFVPFIGWIHGFGIWFGAF